MTQVLNLTDIQGNILKGYGRLSFPKARYIFFHISRAESGRLFINSLIPHLTTSIRWRPFGGSEDDIERPTTTLNLAFSYEGLKALELPFQSLRGFSDAFQMGMQARSAILGDDNSSSPQYWDPIWSGKPVHLWVSIYAQNVESLEKRYLWLIRQLDSKEGGIELLAGHRGDDGKTLPYQDASAVYRDGLPSSQEHFGYHDVISNPFFEGCELKPERLQGNGKRIYDKQGDRSWQALATGEFLLGHPDEAKEYPAAPTPRQLGFNGTYLVYRKLHQNVGSFKSYCEQMATQYPGNDVDLFMAKLMGRWPDGTPLTLASSTEAKQAVDIQMSRLLEQAQTSPDAAEELVRLRQNWRGFDYISEDDPYGFKCPVSSHTRRANPRASLEISDSIADSPSGLVNRHRIIRRGMPYGAPSHVPSDSGNQGIIFMALNACIERQFEYVQQQWLNYGDAFNQSNDKDVVAGNQDGKGKSVIPSDPQSGHPPFFATKVPRFVETRGGEYFFMPSITALRMIVRGLDLR